MKKTFSCNLLAVAALLGAAATSCAFAQAVGAAGYPLKPITVVVPVAPGGTADFLIRTLSQRAAELLGQPVVMQHKPGASAVIASQAVAQAPADGYTVLLAYTSHAINIAAYPTLPYDTLKAFAPVSLLGKVPMVLVTGNAVPAKTVAELVEYGKSHPGSITYGASGLGGAGHLGAELMAMMGGFPMTTVPYKGGSEAIVDLLAGRIAVMQDSYSVFEQHIASGSLRVLGVSSSGRQEFLPNVPAIAESIPGYEAVAWWGLLVPAATPREAVDRLSAAYAKAWQDPEIRSKLVKRGWEPAGSTPAVFNDFIRSEISKWTTVVKKINFQAGK